MEYCLPVLLANWYFNWRYSKIAWPVITIANIIQTVPAIAMLAILMLALGLGPSTVVFAVFLYALLPIIKTPTQVLQKLTTILKTQVKVWE